MESNQKNYKWIRRKTGIFLTVILAIISIVGIGFGFNKAVKNSSSIDSRYNDYVQIETKVNFKSSDKNIDDAANSIHSTFKFLGIQNSTINIIGSDTLIISNPVSSYFDNEKNSIDMMGEYENNISYFSEMVSLTTSLLFNGTLDFRTEDGQEIFPYGKIPGSSKEGYYFSEENMTSGNIEEEYDETSNSTTTNSSISPGEFYKSASISYSKGYPVIKIGIKPKGNSSSDYKTMFTNFNNYINSNETTNYVVWFNFDETFKILNILGLVDSKETMYETVSNNTTLRPLYSTATDEPVFNNFYENIIQLKGTYTEREAKYFVSKINNSNSFKYSDTKLILIVMASILLVMIIGIIFSFVTYFGLLGVISSIAFLIINSFMIVIYSLSGIAVTGLGLSALFIIALFSAMIIYLTTNTYKNNNKDKFISITKRFFNKFIDVNKLLFASLVSLILILYISGIFLNTLLALVIYLISIATVISYLVSVFILLPLIYLIDLLMEFSKDDYVKKWNWINGFNINIKNNINTEVKGIKQKTLGSVLVGVVVILLSSIIGGSLHVFMGSPANINFYGTKDYIYNVKVIDKEAEINIIDGDSSSGSEFIDPYYEYAKNDLDSVKNSFEDNGVKISNINIVRRDEIKRSNIGTLEEEITILSTFGYQLTSKIQITEEMKKNINIILLDSGFGNDYYSKGFELVDELSLTSGIAQKNISYTENKYIFQGLLSLFMIIIVATFIVFLSVNWGVAIAILLTTLLEAIFIVSPIFILFIPYNFLIWLPILLSIIFSAVIKIRISQMVKNDEVKEKKWIRNTKQMMFVMPTFLIFLGAIELLLIGAYGFITILPLLLITMIIPFVIFIIQQFVYPYFGELLGDFRERIKENKQKEDIFKSKNKSDGEVREEFIDGVNM